MTSYPKLITLLCSFALAYIFFATGILHSLLSSLNGHGLASVFLGGILFSFGFTSAFGVGIFVEVASNVSPWVAAPIGGAGAFLSDLVIFHLVRYSIFHDEVHRLHNSRAMQFFQRCFHHRSISNEMRSILLWSFAGIVIASPLPDEFGITLVSSVTTMSPQRFAALCLLLNTVGIFLILLVAHSS